MITFRALRGDCGPHSRPSTQAILRSGLHRFACSNSNIATVRESVAEDLDVFKCWDLDLDINTYIYKSQLLRKSLYIYIYIGYIYISESISDMQ